MFKSWRSDKKKIKAVFKLQFQATQVPQLKKPALTVSLMPDDVGKPTFKLEKAAVQDGTCLWENPVYVAVKLIKQPKSGKLNEKIYHFIVSSGSSKSGYLGEASIDFADFAEEIEPLTVSLPLKFANSGAILHVTIEKMHGGADQRKKEDGDPTLSQDGRLKNYLSNGHTNGDNNNFAENAEQDGSFRASSIGFNASFQSSLRQNSMLQETVDTTITTKNHLHRRSSTDWSLGSASDASLFDSTNSPENNLPREVEETSDESIEKLKNEISSLMRQAELSELELQCLRKQVMKENRRGQDLSRQISDLKEERDELTTECEQLKSSLKCIDRREDLDRLQAENENSRAQLEEIRQELSHEKELKANLKLQLKKTEESNCELILAVRDLDEMLGQKSSEISCLLGKLELSKKADEVQEKTCECIMKRDDNRQALPAPGEFTGEQNDSEEMHLLKQKIIDLSDEIEVYRANREKMENYVEQLTQDYEDLKQENQDLYSKLEQNQQQELKTQNELSDSLATIEELESQVQRLEDKLKKQTKELESLVSINELESQVKELEKELEKQAQGFENDLDAMTNAKIKQEQKAIRAEETLRKTRWNNAITAERLQEEFRRLSVDMAGKFDENEKVTTKALTEANELRIQKRIMEENLQKAIEELALIKDQNKLKVEELSTQLEHKTKHIEQMSSELEDKSKQLRYAQKNGGKMEEALSLEIKKLKATIEMLKKEKNDDSEQAEEMKWRDKTEQLKKSLEDTKTLMERWKGERDELEGMFTFAKKEAGKTQEQLLLLESLKGEKEKMVKNLLSEVQNLRAQYIELKHSLSREELEKQNLQQEVFQLRGELQKNEEERTSMEKKLKNDNGQATFSDEKNRTPSTASKLVQKEVGVPLLERQVKTCSEQQAKVSTLRAKDECDLTELLTEMALLKEKNKSMESELKEMQERYSEISLKFAEVEGERQQLVMTVRNLKNGKKN